MQGQKFNEEDVPEDSVLVGFLYLSIVHILAKTMGIVGVGEPFFVWVELTYEVEVLESAIEELTKAINI